MKLHISGGTHLLTATQQRVSDIHEQVENPDVLFIEDRTESVVPRRSRFYNWISAPFVLLFVNIWLRILQVPADGATDTGVINSLQQEYDVEVIPVDSAIHELLSTGRFGWTAFHWGALSIPAIGVWVTIQQNLVLAYPLSVILAFYGLIVVMGFLAGTMSGRDNRMLLNILRYRTAEEIDEAVLVVGGAHAADLVQLVDGFPEVQANLIHNRTLRDNLYRRLSQLLNLSTK